MKNLPVEDARAIMLAGIAPRGVERVALAQAVGRVLAEPVAAARDQPPFDASAMDGWAIRRADAESGETLLRIAGESAAGHGYAGALGPGEAVRIFTGAAAPLGADTIVLQEDATREGDHVRVGPQAGRPSQIRPRGGDFHAGTVLLEPGTRLDPWRLSLAASAGRPDVAVFRKPRLAIVTTGEEIVPPGSTPGPFQIFNSGATGLSTLVATWGAEVAAVRQAGDSEDAILAAVEGVEAELIVTVGGASVGDHDLVKPALMHLGLELAVMSVKLRPGKPTWFGTLGDGRRVLGLPGNPASAFACAELFLRPLVDAWLGAAPGPHLVWARLADPLRPNGPREHWMRAELNVGPDGVLTARPFREQDSSLVSIFARADALLRRVADAPAAEAGEVVEVLRLERPGS